MHAAIAPGTRVPPRISVLTAVRNGERYLPSAIDSVLAQTEPRFELIVVDDESSDGTPSILEKYAASDGRIRIFRNSCHGGIATTRNVALEHCRAPLVAVFDADDVMMPTRLARQTAAFDAHPEIGMLGSAGWLIDAEGRTTGTFSCPTEDSAIRFRMTVGGAFWNTSTAYRTELLRSLRGYRKAYEGSEDYDLWARLLAVSSGLNLEEPLVAQRIHANSLTALSTIAFESHYRVSARLLQDYLGIPVSEADARAVVSFLHYPWRFRLSREQVITARSVLDRLGNAARTDVDSASKQWLRERATRALFLQARLQSSGDKRFSCRLAVDYAAVNLSGVLTPEFAGLVASLLVPRSLRRAAALVLGRASEGSQAAQP